MGYGLRELAAKISISPSALSTLESKNKLSLGVVAIKRLCLSLDLNYDEVLAYFNKIDPSLKSIILQNPIIYSNKIRSFQK